MKVKVKALSTFTGIATHVKISYIRKKFNSPGVIIMRLSKEQKENNILELYRSGHTYSYLQKRYRISSRDISRIVKGVQVECFFCGKPKGKTRFHAHHPDRVNQPDYTIPACPSCHAREEARIRKERESQLGTPTTARPEPTNRVNCPTTIFPTLPPQPLLRTEKVIMGSFLLLTLFPNLLDDIQRHWYRPSNPGKRPIMGLER